MLAMSDINCIKHLRNNKGLSITKIVFGKQKMY